MEQEEHKQARASGHRGTERGATRDVRKVRPQAYETRRGGEKEKARMREMEEGHKRPHKTECTGGKTVALTGRSGKKGKAKEKDTRCHGKRYDDHGQ